ncbi:MAG: pyruvate ferredoxin oxidoreductase, partial [Oscillospiraceae bacterium]|nr:pyruvate ferredoxin oxidoreductase [Oscillospiraceae bacterium]
VAVDILRERGIRAANLRLKLFRPFPGEELSKLLPSGAKLIVLDRSFAYGAQGGAIYCDARSALYERANEISITGRTIGVGGGDLSAALLADTVEEIIKEGK